jgi:CRISPR-associated protein Csm3
MKLQTIKEIKGTLQVVTGLHIGAGKDTLEIGGLDQPIIKHPLTQEPYIPGSSIKGKMRSMLEVGRFAALNPETDAWVNGKNSGGVGKPCGCGQKGCAACTIFGTSAANKSPELGPTRLIVRDAQLNDEWRQRFSSGQLQMEVKYENTIDRVKGTAEHPRPLERIPSGVCFDFNLSFKVYEGDDEKLLDEVFYGLRLLELDALGGNSSRGCGQILFADLTCDTEPVDLDNYRPQA